MRAVDPFRADLVLAALFVVAGVDRAATARLGGPQPPDHHRGGRALRCPSLAFRRRDPVLAAVIFAVPVCVQAFARRLPHDEQHDAVRGGDPAVLYSIGRYSPTRGSCDSPCRCSSPACSSTLATEAGLEGVEDFFWVVFLFGLPVLAGRALRSRAMLQAELREKAEQAERDRRARALTGAVEDERARIAAELQALVANGLSAMVVQAETVPRALAAGDSARAGAALAAVETTGRDALTEMRTPARRPTTRRRRRRARPAAGPRAGRGARGANSRSVASRWRSASRGVRRRGRRDGPRLPRSRPHRLQGRSRTRSKPQRSRVRPLPSC